MKTAEYSARDATGLAQLIRSGEVSATEVLDTCIALIEEHNPELNAVICPLYNEAKAALSAVPADSPFPGVPLLLKDLGHHLAGTPSFSGNAALRDVSPVSEQNSFIVDKLASGGFVFPGKTNVPEFGLLGTTEPKAFGPARNPWSKDRTPGGSSGGSAAMVAVGAVPLATANDGGGSIRIPASYCGLVGLKPSRGVISNGPHYADLWDGLNSDLVVSRSVRDTVAVLGLLAGNMPGDPYAGPTLDLAAATTPVSSPLRVAVATRPLIDVPVDDSAVEATWSMAKLLESFGHTVEEAAPDVSGDLTTDVFSKVYMSAAAADYRRVQQIAGKAAAKRGTEAETRFLAYLGTCLTGEEYHTARRDANTLNRGVADFFGRYDIFLTPTTAGIAHEIGATGPTPMQSRLSGLVSALGLGRKVLNSNLLHDTFREMAGRVPFTQLANICGLPAINLPAFRDALTGLPVGVMLTAPMGADVQLLQLAAQVEAECDWRHSYPFMSQ